MVWTRGPALECTETGLGGCLQPGDSSSGKGRAHEAFIVLNFISFQEKKKSKNDKILATLRSEWCVQGFLLCFFCMFEIQLNILN